MLREPLTAHCPAAHASRRLFLRGILRERDQKAGIAAGTRVTSRMQQAPGEAYGGEEMSVGTLPSIGEYLNTSYRPRLRFH
jgi:hypothetical protein